MALTVEIKPDLSAFRAATVEEIMETVQCDRSTAEQLREHYWMVPR